MYAHSKEQGEKEYHNDIYVFDEHKQLAMLILGVRFTRVAIASLTKVLSAASMPQTERTSRKKTGKAVTAAPKTSNKPVSTIGDMQTVPRPGGDSDIKSKIRKLLHSVADVPLDSIKNDSTLEDLGVDSLTNTEFITEFRDAFHIEIPLGEVSDLHTVNALSEYVVRNSSLEQAESSDRSVATPSSSSASRDESPSSPASSVSEAPQLLGDNQRAKLAKLVAEQLETNVALSSATCLGDLGMDSLLSVEMERDIEEAFGVDLQPGSLTGETTFGDLHSTLLEQLAVPPAQSSQTVDPVKQTTILVQNTSTYAK